MNKELSTIPNRTGEGFVDLKKLREVNTKEEMVRMAERSGCRIEIVNQSEVLTNFGGVGCLLRYITPDPALRTYGRTFRRETSVH